MLNVDNCPQLGGKGLGRPYSKIGSVHSLYCRRADLKQSWVGSKSDNVGKNWENTSFPYKSPPQAEIFEISGQNRWETL